MSQLPVRIVSTPPPAMSWNGDPSPSACGQCMKNCGVELMMSAELRTNNDSICESFSSAVKAEKHAMLPRNCVPNSSPRQKRLMSLNTPCVAPASTCAHVSDPDEV